MGTWRIIVVISLHTSKPANSSTKVIGFHITPWIVGTKWGWLRISWWIRISAWICWIITWIRWVIWTWSSLTVVKIWSRVHDISIGSSVVLIIRIVIRIGWNGIRLLVRSIITAENFTLCKKFLKNFNSFIQKLYLFLMIVFIKYKIFLKYLMWIYHV